jgi:hypothetical protein
LVYYFPLLLELPFPQAAETISIRINIMRVENFIGED